MRNYLENFLIEYDFPIESRGVFLDAYDKIISSEKSKGLFLKATKMYEESYACDYKLIFNEYFKEIYEDCCVPLNTSSIVWFITISPTLKKYYQQLGYDLQIYKDTVADLKYKTIEDYPSTKIWGWSKPMWHADFYKLVRFGFNQLQFNLYPFNDSYHKNGIDLKADDMIVKTHLPMTGEKLDVDKFLDTFNRAGEFFKQFLPNKPIVFYCNSWILYSGHLHILKPTSPILKFRNMFEIIGEKEYEDNHELKRIFLTDDFSNLDNLPNKTSMQRHYIEKLRKGEKPGYAWGIRIYKK